MPSTAVEDRLLEKLQRLPIRIPRDDSVYPVVQRAEITWEDNSKAMVHVGGRWWGEGASEGIFYSYRTKSEGGREVLHPEMLHFGRLSLIKNYKII